MNLFADRMATLGTENAFQVGADIAKAEAEGMDVIRFNLGEPDFDTPEFICKVACDNIMNGNTHYCPPAGIPQLRETLANDISKTRGFSVAPEQVVITPGAKPPISYTLLTYVNPGDEVIYPSPGFPIYESMVTFVGATPVPLHLKESKGFSFSADELSQLITSKTKLIIICSPSNPTGGVLSGADIESIAEVINEKCNSSVRVFSDEVYERILFDGSVHKSIASVPGMQDKTIVVSGHSKSFAMTGWRLGFAVLPTEQEAKHFTNFNINIISCTPPFSQVAGVEAYINEKTNAEVLHMVKNFEERRNYATPALNAIDGVTCANPKGAFYVFPNIQGMCENLDVFEHHKSLPTEIKVDAGPSKLIQMFLIYRYGVATMDRQSFGSIGSKDMHFLRLSTATDLESIKKGIDRINKASKDRNGFANFIKEGKHLC